MSCDRDDPSKSIAPKFASFKLASARLQEKETEDKQCREQRLERKSGALSRNTSEHYRRKRGYNERHIAKNTSQSRHKHRSRSPSKQSKSPEKHAPDGLKELENINAGKGPLEQLYYLDSKGDLGNVVYGRSHKYAVPNYVRIGRGRVIGLARWNIINRERSSENAVVISNPVYSNPVKLSSLHIPIDDSEEITITSNMQARDRTDTAQEYISLNDSDKEGNSSREQSSGDEETDFRSIRGPKIAKSKAVEDSPNLIQSGLGDGRTDQATKVAAQIRERNIYLTQLVKSKPGNLQAWLDLAEHQEAIATLGRSAKGHNLTSTERGAVSDIKISIYQDALRAIGDDDVKRVHLIESLMTEGSSVWENRMIISNWKKYIDLYPRSIKLWKLYFNFLQSNLAEFHFEDCKLVFMQCLRYFSDFKKEEDVVDAKLEQWEFMIYLILRFSILARDAGYSEIAVALWQAQLEYHVFDPLAAEDLQTVGSKVQSTIDLFEDFWESEVPRIGESGALGWKTYYLNGGEPIESAKDIGSASIGRYDVFRSFAEQEYLLSASQYLPGKSMDDTDDPYSVVLFNDTKDFIEHAPRYAPKNAWIKAFLCFCSFPPLKSCTDLDNLDHWWQDTYLRTRQILPKNDSGISLLTSTRTTLRTMLSGNFSQDDKVLPTSWVENVLTSLASTTGIGDDALQYYLAYKYHFDGENIDHLAKKLLKTRTTSVKLLTTYGLIKFRQGQGSVGKNVFSSVLQISTRLPQSEKKNLLFLWQVWAWESLLSGDLGTAMNCVMSSCNISSENNNNAMEQTATQTQIDSAEQALTNARSTSMIAGRFDEVIAYTECLAILTYLQSSRELSTALQVFRETSNLFNVHSLATSAANEVNHQSEAEFLALHMKNSKLVKPGMVRSVLSESIRAFPNNTMFLTMYHANEARFRIDDRVRAIVRDAVLDRRDETVIGWHFAVWAEQQRGVEVGSTVHSVRATYERAISSDSCKSSPTLWRAYVLFEHSLGDLQRARKVFMEGLRRLPWVKDYMMLAFTHLRSVMGDDELRSVYNVMGEKELRVRVDLSGIFREWDEERKKKLMEAETA